MWLLILLLNLKLANAADYTDAANHAKDAFLIQTGIQGSINKAGIYAEQKTKLYINRWGLTNPTTVLLFSYSIYRNRAISFMIGKRERVELKLDGINFTFGLP